MPQADLDRLLSVDVDGWRDEFEAIGDFLTEFGNHVPQALHDRREAIAAALGEAER